MKLSELAEIVGARLESGDPDLEIKGAAGLDIAGPEFVSFLSNPKYTKQVYSTEAGAVLVGDTVEIDDIAPAVLRAEDAYVAYTLALRAFHPPREVVPFIHPSATIDPSAEIADNVEIGANAVIGALCKVESGVRIEANVTLYWGVKVGRNTVIHSGTSVRADCEIGSGCIIQNNCTIGSDGFGYARTKEGKWLKIPQTGRVVLEDDVEIGANTTIDKASVGESRIGRGTKIDNLVQIGHSCTIGEDSLLCSQVGLAGSSKIGDRVILAGQVGIAGHLRVGNDVTMTAKSATSHDVRDGSMISGVPAFEHREWLRSTAAFRRLGSLFERVRKLEKRMGEKD